MLFDVFWFRSSPLTGDLPLTLDFPSVVDVPFAIDVVKSLMAFKISSDDECLAFSECIELALNSALLLFSDGFRF